MMSRCEEENDEGNLDNRQEGEPQQKDVHEGIRMSGPWHFQSEGAQDNSEEPSFFCCKPKAVCVYLCVCVRACFLSAECADDALISGYALLCPECTRCKEESSWYFPLNVYWR